MTGDSILSKFQKARQSMVKNLVQILNMVPVMLAAEVSPFLFPYAKCLHVNQTLLLIISKIHSVIKLNISTQC